MNYLTGAPDIFICFSSRDRDLIAKPLADHLKGIGLDVWFDEYSILVGKSVSREIHMGVKKALIGVPILSPSFFQGNWTLLELGKLHSKMIEDPNSLFPLYWNIENDAVAKELPWLADAKALKINPKNIKEIAEEIFTHVKNRQNKKFKKIFAYCVLFLLGLFLIPFLYKKFNAIPSQPIKTELENSKTSLDTSDKRQLV